MLRNKNLDLKYSQRTVALAFEALTLLRGGELKLRLSRYVTKLIFENPGSKPRWASYALQRIEAQNPLSLNQVVEDVAKEGPTNEVFLDSLKADGFEVVEKGKIVPLLATTVTPAKEESVLEERLSTLGWEQAKQHLTEGISSYEQGNWTAANSQFRTFLEDVFNQIAKHYGIKKSGGNARETLHRRNFLREEESKMVQGTFNFLHTKGAHPGMSEEFEARMRRYLVEVIALYFIEKFQKPNTEEDVSF